MLILINISLNYFNLKMLLLLNHIHSFLLLYKMENTILSYIFSGREISSFHFIVEQFVEVLTECYVRKNENLIFVSPHRVSGERNICILKVFLLGTVLGFHQN